MQTEQGIATHVSRKSIPLIPNIRSTSATGTPTASVSPYQRSTYI